MPVFLVNMKNIMSDVDRENIFVIQFAVQTFDCLIIYMFHYRVVFLYEMEFMILPTFSFLLKKSFVEALQHLIHVIYQHEIHHNIFISFQLNKIVISFSLPCLSLLFLFPFFTLYLSLSLLLSFKLSDNNAII